MHLKELITMKKTKSSEKSREYDENLERALSLESIDVKKRIQWGHQVEFFLSCVGYAVGLGNLWRFPYLCMQQGGGAFLLPYLLFLFICGVPLFFMELVIGQSSGLTTVRFFNMLPFFKGLGWCMVSASGVLCIYYNNVIAWVIYFFARSFTWNLPWSTCNNTWNTADCFNYADFINNNNSVVRSLNATSGKFSAAEEFWSNEVLKISSGIDDIAGINWQLMLCLIGAWVLTFVCMIKGIRTSGKVVYVTAVLPYILLTVILIRGVTLPGSSLGIRYYLIPDWEKLKHPEIWTQAATQIFYSLGPAWGGLITFSSYNKYTNNILRDSLLIPVICAFTSIYGGFAIFSVIGHVLYITGQDDTSALIRQGPGLAFIAYPEALARLPGAAIWSVLFFATLLTLGIDSQFATLETLTSGLIDRFPNVLGKHKILFTLLVCVVQCCIGLIFVTRAGFYYFELMDVYATAFSVVIIGCIECVVVSYLFGASRLLSDCEHMIGKVRKCTRYWWLFMWRIVVPIVTFVIIINTCVAHYENYQKEEQKFPPWAVAIGWTVGLCSLIHLPMLAIHSVFKHRHNWRTLFKVNSEWRQVVEKRRIAFTEDQEE